VSVPSAFRSAEARGFRGFDTGRDRAPTIINIDFNGPVTNPRRTARELQDALAGRG
jgi:hypothetical protein